MLENVCVPVLRVYSVFSLNSSKQKVEREIDNGFCKPNDQATICGSPATVLFASYDDNLRFLI